MGKLFLVIGCLFSISILFACKSKKLNQTPKQELGVENPKPISEVQTDSLKNYLDLERERRRKK